MRSSVFNYFTYVPSCCRPLLLPLYIKDKGCLLTCFSMANGTSPLSENVKLTAVGAINEDGDFNSEKAADWSGYSYQKLPGSLSQEEVMGIICKGGHVIAEVISPNNSGGNHFVLVTGAIYDVNAGKCKLAINDPATKKAKIYLEDFGVGAVKSYRGFTKYAG